MVMTHEDGHYRVAALAKISSTSFGFEDDQVRSLDMSFIYHLVLCPNSPDSYTQFLDMCPNGESNLAYSISTFSLLDRALDHHKPP